MTTALLRYCRDRQWSGADPYDALNSRLLQSSGAYRSAFVRLFATQLLKRLPLDARGLLDVPGTQNPKGLALFLRAMLKLEKMGMVPDGGDADRLTARILELRSPGTDHWCWGYSFAWQTRTHLVPKGEPNLVCSVFVANALLDAHERRPDERLLQAVASCCDYIVHQLFRDNPAGVYFAYPLPISGAAVHNANLLAAALLCRSARLCKRPDFVGPALAAARYSLSRQRADGSWLYGDAPSQAWVDNFHTGFNLSALLVLGRKLGMQDFHDAARKGLDFYLEHFFLDNGVARYFHDRTYPIDIHSIAQSITTLAEFSRVEPRCLPKLEAVAGWAADNMFDARGFFYYRKLRLLRNKISYMRWSQAWMLLALSTMLELQHDRRF